MRIILASKSPRRKELLFRLIDDFLIIPSNIDEDKYKVDTLSYLKAEKIGNIYQDDLVISADTIVILDDLILGKPRDEKEAIKMLKMLSNRAHEVDTYYTFYWAKKNICFTRKVTSKVYFNKLDDDLINRYVASKSPFDKAGGYGIQDKEFALVNKIDGEIENVMGFPIKEIKEDLIKLNIKIKKA